MSTHNTPDPAITVNPDEADQQTFIDDESRGIKGWLDDHLPRTEATHWGVLVGLVGIIVACLLPWANSPNTGMGDLTWFFDPGTLQYLTIAFGVAGLGLWLARRGITNAGKYADTRTALMSFGLWTFALGLVLIVSFWQQPPRNPDGSSLPKSISDVGIGSWLIPVLGLLIWLCARMLPDREHKDLALVRFNSFFEIAAIIILLAVMLYAAAYVLSRDDGGEMLAFLVLAGGLAATAVKSRLAALLGHVTTRHRQVLSLGALAVALVFPLTQHGNDTNMTIASQVIAFGVTAMGLNIVIGLAGLLDLGYIAFFGTGAYMAAMLSQNAGTLGWHPPFLVVVLVSAITAAVIGLIIGSPTLRVSGDYLAIVTLGFGEIFRIAVNNLDGQSGKDLTHGSGGMANIEPLKVFGFDFSQTHHVFGVPISEMANYYLLLVLLLAVVIVIFTRLNDSRIGRGWIAIREDEKAADAMGVNVFALKLLAFAVGAMLAGLAGTIKAHQDKTVTPQGFEFLESAFLVAAVVLGGMGTVAGVLLGATLLKLLPEKLRFVDNYRMMLFGLVLIVMMRFRPEGLIPSRRRQLEFHSQDEELAESVEEAHLEDTR